MTSGGSFSTFISSSGVVTSEPSWMDGVEADGADGADGAPLLSSPLTDKAGVVLQSVSVQQRTVDSEKQMIDDDSAHIPSELHTRANTNTANSTVSEL